MCKTDLNEYLFIRDINNFFNPTKLVSYEIRGRSKTNDISYDI